MKKKVLMKKLIVSQERERAFHTTDNRLQLAIKQLAVELDGTNKNRLTLLDDIETLKKENKELRCKLAVGDKS